jgi:hypothetical protein
MFVDLPIDTLSPTATDTTCRNKIVKTGQTTIQFFRCAVANPKLQFSSVLSTGSLSKSAWGGSGLCVGTSMELSIQPMWKGRVILHQKLW